MIYLQLLWVFIKIGVLGFGGGYAMLSLIQHEVVDNYGWMTTTDFADMVAISQMTPGPISINLATYVGSSQGGFPCRWFPCRSRCGRWLPKWCRAYSFPLCL